MLPARILRLLALPALLCGCPPSQPRTAPLRHAAVEPAPRLVLAPQPSPSRHLVAEAEP